MKEENFEKIAVLDSEIEARLLAAILEDRGIAHQIRSYHDTAYDGIFQLTKGWGALRAPQSAKDEILSILADIRTQADTPDQDPEA